jgi:hypothetical protein
MENCVSIEGSPQKVFQKSREKIMVAEIGYYDQENQLVATFVCQDPLESRQMLTMHLHLGRTPKIPSMDQDQ